MLITRRLFAFLGAAAASTLVAAAPVAGQATFTPAPRCDRVDTTASWYHRQAEWWALDAKHDWTNDSVRSALIHAAQGLEPPRTTLFPLQLGVDITPVDSRSTVDSTALGGARQLLRDMIRRRTWPTRSLVGSAGARATWLIMRGDSALTAGGMRRMMEAGPGEAAEFDVAVLEDWVRLANGRKQLNAIQLHFERDAGGRIRFTAAPTEDAAHVDLRRDAAGLPPLALALCLANQQVH